MILLTDISFFNQPIEIANINETQAVVNNVMNQVRRYEPEILKDVLGYGLYSSLQNALVTNSTASIWTNLLFGSEYTYQSGCTKYWRGIVESDATVFTYGAGQIGFKKPEWVIVGVTTNSNGDIIIPAGGTTFSNPDWIGWTPILQKDGIQTLQPEVDYDYDMLTGNGSLDKPDDIFTSGERFFVQFEVIYNPVTTDNAFTYKASFIADYVYYWYRRNNVTSTSGIGETVPTSKNADNASPAQKMADAWNDMSQRLCEMWDYLDSNLGSYTDWMGRDYRVVRKYGIMNPLF